MSGQEIWTNWLTETNKNNQKKKKAISLTKSSATRISGQE